MSAAVPPSGLPGDREARLIELAMEIAVLTAERNRLIVTAHQKGATALAIARAGGVSYPTVLHIVTLADCDVR